MVQDFYFSSGHLQAPVMGNGDEPKGSRPAGILTGAILRKGNTPAVGNDAVGQRISKRMNI